MLAPGTGTGELAYKFASVVVFKLMGEPLEISKESWSLHCPSLKLECP